MRVISISLDGYADKYGFCIESHRKYCDKNNYEYFLLDSLNSWPQNIPSFGSVNPQKKAYGWLKIPIILSCLKEKKENVFWVDGDAQITERCPSVESLLVEDKDVYISKGRSGRFNSGVFLVKNTVFSINLFESILSNSFVDFNSKIEGPPLNYENAAIIYYFNLNIEKIKIIDKRWNNSYDKEMKDDYIRHYTGVLRK